MTESPYGIVRYKDESMTQVNDRVVTEEPLEIFLDGNPFYMTMRLPGDEIPLALGYLFSEGIVETMDDAFLINYCGEENGNRLHVTLDRQWRGDGTTEPKERRLPAYSSCGLCGKELINDICTSMHQRGSSFHLPVWRIDTLLETVRQNQAVFLTTGATHAAAAFSRDLELLEFSEDVGRHNALDKVLGKLLISERIKDVVVIVTTSRMSYEVVQKAARSGAEVLIGISSATSMAVELAREVNLTLIGFARSRQGNIYSAAERLVL